MTDRTHKHFERLLRTTGMPVVQLGWLAQPADAPNTQQRQVQTRTQVTAQPRKDKP